MSLGFARLQGALEVGCRMRRGRDGRSPEPFHRPNSIEATHLMKCPTDQSDLERQTYEGEIEIDRCPSCGGVWLDQGELEKAQENLAADHSDRLGRIGSVAQAYEFARQQAQIPSSCPKCDSELYPEEYGYCSQILVDRCPSCLGIWLDAGELQSLEAFFEKESRVGAGARQGFWASLFRRS